MVAVGRYQGTGQMPLAPDSATAHRQRSIPDVFAVLHSVEMNPGNRRVRSALRLADGLPQRGEAEQTSARRHGTAVGKCGPGLEYLAALVQPVGAVDRR